MEFRAKLSEFKEQFMNDWVDAVKKVTNEDRGTLQNLFNQHYQDGYIEIFNSVYFESKVMNAVDFYYKSQGNLILNANGVCIIAYNKKESITGWTLINGMGVRQIFKAEKNRMANIGNKIDEEFNANLESKVKVKLNGFYGLNGYLKAYIYNIDIADTVTTSGRNIIAIVSIINELLGNGYRYYLVEAHLAIINAVMESDYDELCEKYDLPDVDVDTVLKVMLGEHYNGYYSLSFLRNTLLNMPYNALKVLYMRNNFVKVLEVPKIRERLKTLLEAAKIDNLITEINGGQMINPMKHERTKTVLTELCDMVTELVYGFYYYSGDYINGEYQPTMVDIVQNMRRNKIALADTDSNVTVFSDDKEHIMKMFPELFSDDEESNILANNVVVLSVMYMYLASMKRGLRQYALAVGIDEKLVKYIDLECEMIMDQTHLASGKKAYTYNYSIKDFMRRPGGYKVKGLTFIKSDQNPKIGDIVNDTVKSQILKDPYSFKFKDVINHIRDKSNEVYELITSKDFILNDKTVRKTKDNTVSWNDHRIKAVRLWNRLNPDNLIELPGSFGECKIDIDINMLDKFSKERPEIYNEIKMHTFEIMLWKTINGIVTKIDKINIPNSAGIITASKTDLEKWKLLSDKCKSGLRPIYNKCKEFIKNNIYNDEDARNIIESIYKLDMYEAVVNLFGVDCSVKDIDIVENITKIALPMDIGDIPELIKWNKAAFLDKSLAADYEHKLGQLVTTMGIMCPVNKDGRTMTTSVLTVF